MKKSGDINLIRIYFSNAKPINILQKTDYPFGDIFYYDRDDRDNGYRYFFIEVYRTGISVYLPDGSFLCV